MLFQIQLDEMRQRQFLEQQQLEKEFAERKAKLLNDRDKNDNRMVSLEKVIADGDDDVDEIVLGRSEEIFWPKCEDSSSSGQEGNISKTDCEGSAKQSKIKSSFAKLSTDFGFWNKDVKEKKSVKAKEKSQKKNIFKKPNFKSSESKEKSVEDVRNEENSGFLTTENEESLLSNANNNPDTFIVHEEEDSGVNLNSTQNTQSPLKKKLSFRLGKSNKKTEESSPNVSKKASKSKSKKQKDMQENDNCDEEKLENVESAIHDVNLSELKDTEKQDGKIKRISSWRRKSNSKKKESQSPNKNDGLLQSDDKVLELKEETIEAFEDLSIKKSKANRFFKNTRESLDEKKSDSSPKKDNSEKNENRNKDFLKRSASQSKEKDEPVQEEPQEEKLLRSRKSFRDIFNTTRSKSLPAKESRIPSKSTKVEDCNEIPDSDTVQKDTSRIPKVKREASSGKIKNLPDSKPEKSKTSKRESISKVTGEPLKKSKPLFKKSDNKKVTKIIAPKKEIKRKITPYHRDSNVQARQDKIDQDHLLEVYQLTSCEKIHIPEIQGRNSEPLDQQTSAPELKNRQMGRRTGRFRKP